MCPSMTSAIRASIAPRQAEMLCSTSEHSASSIERSFDGVHLPSDAPYAIEQFLLFVYCVCHKKDSDEN